MKYLWAAWRMKYISKAEPDDGCIFCKALEKTDSAENLIVARGERTFLILNKFPYTSGHVMVVPFQHVDSLDLLDALTRAEMMETVSRATVVLREIYKSQGFNIGINMGVAAGAGVPGHVHIHIVSRWGGDTNFMSTVGEVRVLPEELEQTYERIKQGWEKNL